MPMAWISRTDMRRVLAIEGQLAKIDTAEQQRRGTQHNPGVLRRTAGESGSTYDVAYWRDQWQWPTMRRAFSAMCIAGELIVQRMEDPVWAAPDSTLLLRPRAFPSGQGGVLLLSKYGGESPTSAEAPFKRTLTELRPMPSGSIRPEEHVELALNELQILASGAWKANSS